jgi:predicted house-cleaning NTP pyrophosphatase (Maf/HAM1 superfamily)
MDHETYLEKEFDELAVRTVIFVDSSDENMKKMIVYPRALAIIWASEKINDLKKEIEKLKNDLVIAAEYSNFVLSKDANNKESLDNE